MDYCTPITLDLDNINQIIQIVGKADYFIHLGWDGIAAQGRSNPFIQEKNVKIAINCLMVAATLHCHSFLFAGSQAEYGLKNEVIREDTFCEPGTEYGKGKLRVGA